MDRKFLIRIKREKKALFPFELPELNDNLT